MNYGKKQVKQRNYKRNVENVRLFSLKKKKTILILFFLVPKHDITHNKLNSALQEVSNYYSMLEEREKQALRSAMIEERSRFCTLFTLLKPVMVNRLERKFN
jgi:hypothetical protein